MAPFDPAAATAAHLAQMSPAALARSIAYTHGKEWLILWGGLISILEAWIIVRLGVLPRLSDVIEKNRPRPLLTSLVLGCSYLVISWAVNLPWSIWADWWFEKAHGMTSQGLGGWFTDNLIQTGFSTLIGTIFLVLLYLLLRVTRRSLGLTGSLFVVVLLALLYLLLRVARPVVVAVGGHRHRQPVRRRPARQAGDPRSDAEPLPAGRPTVGAGSRSGPRSRDRDPHRQDIHLQRLQDANRYTATVAGLFGTARVAMSDVMFQKGADLAEVRGVVGHEMGHYVHQHALWGAGALTLLSFGLYFLADKLFPVFARLPGAGGRGGYRRSGRRAGAVRCHRDADPAGAPDNQRPHPLHRVGRGQLLADVRQRAGRTVQGPGQNCRLPRAVTFRDGRGESCSPRITRAWSTACAMPWSGRRSI